MRDSAFPGRRLRRAIERAAELIQREQAATKAVAELRSRVDQVLASRLEDIDAGVAALIREVRDRQLGSIRSSAASRSSTCARQALTPRGHRPAFERTLGG